MDLRYTSARGRLVLLATVLGSALAFIDATVVNVALPKIGASLHSGLSGLTWTVNAYTLTLSALILLGGSLGDRFGRRRVFLIGVIWFGAASLLCGVAPSIEILVAARALQGIGGALMTPGSLAIIQSSFREEDRGRAIGAWSGLGGISGAAGPLLGGWLVQYASWRWALLINVPVALAVVVLSLKFVPESRDERATKQIDLVGAGLGAGGLGLVTYGLITAQDLGVLSGQVLLALVVGVATLIAFGLFERRAREPLLPTGLFQSRMFSAVNAVTFLVYGALGAIFFWLILELQIVSHFKPFEAGLAAMPMMGLMLVLSPRMGQLSQRIGPRLPMTLGPLLAALGCAWMSRIGPEASYLKDVLGPVVLLGLGLSVTVAPLTTAVLAAAPETSAGIASGINNAVARVAGLLSVAVLPLLTGLRGEGYHHAAELLPAYRVALMLCAASLAAGAALSARFVRKAEPRDAG